MAEKWKKTNVKATRQQLKRMYRDVLVRFAVDALAELVLLGLLRFVMSDINSAPEAVLVWPVFGVLWLVVMLVPVGDAFLIGLPKFRRIDAAMHPEDYGKWMKLRKNSTVNLPKEDVAIAHAIYRKYRLRLEDAAPELERLLEREIKAEWYRRLTIAMLCGLLVCCREFHRGELLEQAKHHRKQAGQFVFAPWLDCLDNEPRRARMEGDFLDYWDKKLFPRR